MSKLEVIDKIRKLLALSKSSNEHEAALAATRAREMLSKYNLEMAEILERGEDSEQLKATRRDLKAGPRGRVDRWMQTLFGGVAKAFDCEPVISNSALGSVFVFIGLPSDVEVAIYTYEYLAKTVKRLAKEKLSRLVEQNPMTKRSRLRYSYFHGAVVGILSQLQKGTAEIVKAEQCTALVLVKKDQVVRYMTQAFPNLKESKTRIKLGSQAAFSQGVHDGRQVSIPSGLGAGRPQERIA